MLIEGPSGSGKSDLALRLIDRGAVLVSDDYTIVRRVYGRLVATAAPNIAGLIEVRGIGPVAMPFEPDVPVALIVTIVDQVARLPKDGLNRSVAGVAVPVGTIASLEASAPVKIEMLLKLRGLT